MTAARNDLPAARPVSLDVLVVDDDAHVREATRLLLAVEGYAVATACDGVDALRALRAGALPRVIVLDLEMPRMGGWDFCAAQLREPALAAIPVVIVSGSRAPSPAGLTQVVARFEKPGSVARLLAVIAQHCGRVADGAPSAPTRFAPG